MTQPQPPAQPSAQAPGQAPGQLRDQPATTPMLTPAHRWLGSWWLVASLILGITAFRLLVTVALNPFTLAEDEAYYLEWSRRLDWSYFSKGPGVAWAIAASVRLFDQSPGTPAEWAVRLPSFLAAALGAVAVAGLAWSMLRDRRAVFLAALLYLLLPGLQVPGWLMTIDSPYLAAWAWACWMGWLALAERRGPAWLGLGLALAVGFVFKYTILLLPLGLLTFLLLRPRPTHTPTTHTPAAHTPTTHTPRPHALWPIAGVALALLGLLPVLIYNAQHHWPTLVHLLDHLGLVEGRTPAPPTAHDPYSPLWTLGYVASLIGVALGLVPLSVFAWLNLGRAARGLIRSSLTPHPAADRPGLTAPRLLLARAFAFACAAPILTFYLLVTFFTEAEWNWAVAAWVSLTVPAAWAAIDGRERLDRPVRSAWVAAWGPGAFILVLVPVIPLLASLPFIDRVVPAQRVTGLRDHAAEVAGILARLRDDTGLPPLIMTNHWGRAAQLTRYLPDAAPNLIDSADPRSPAHRPEVLCLTRVSRARGMDVECQYDLWPDTDIRDPATHARLLGRPAYLSGESRGFWLRAFERVDELGVLPTDPKQNRPSFIGYNYQGFDTDTATPEPHP